MSGISAEDRKAIVRGICASEGHGPLANATTWSTVGILSRYICQRGCGTIIYELERAMTLDELKSHLDRNGVGSWTLSRGRVEASIE